MDRMEEERQRRKAVWWIAEVRLVVFLVYPLSAGPAGVLATHYNNLEAFGVVYGPLHSACEFVGCDVVLMQYEKWCLQQYFIVLTPEEGKK